MEKCPECGLDMVKYEAEENSKRIGKRKSLDQEFDLFYKSNKFAKSDFWKTARLSVPLDTFLLLGLFFLTRTLGPPLDTSWNVVFFLGYLIIGSMFGFLIAQAKRGNKKLERRRKFFVERGEGGLLTDREIWW